jgi:hypothetical protein
MQSVPINTKVASSNPAHDQVHSNTTFYEKFGSDLQQVSGFLWIFQFPPPIKLTAMILLKYC